MTGNLRTVGEAIREFLKAYDLEDRLTEAGLKAVCDQVLGPDISREVTGVSFRNHTLTISLKRSAMKQELEYSKSLIMNNINREMKQEIVHKVIIR
jgi:hypothetical protein